MLIWEVLSLKVWRAREDISVGTRHRLSKKKLEIEVRVVMSDLSKTKLCVLDVEIHFNVIVLDVV